MQVLENNLRMFSCLYAIFPEMFFFYRYTPAMYGHALMLFLYISCIFLSVCHFVFASMSDLTDSYMLLAILSPNFASFSSGNVMLSSLSYDIE